MPNPSPVTLLRILSYFEKARVIAENHDISFYADGFSSAILRMDHLEQYLKRNPEIDLKETLKGIISEIEVFMLQELHEPEKFKQALYNIRSADMSVLEKEFPERQTQAGCKDMPEDKFLMLAYSYCAMESATRALDVATGKNTCRPRQNISATDFDLDICSVIDIARTIKTEEIEQATASLKSCLTHIGSRPVNEFRDAVGDKAYAMEGALSTILNADILDHATRTKAEKALNFIREVAGFDKTPG